MTVEASRFKNFISASLAEQGASTNLSSKVLDMWDKIVSAGKPLPLPVIENDSNRFKYIWNYLPVYLEIEVSEDKVFWFAKDKSLNEIDSGHDFDGLRLWVTRITVYAYMYACPEETEN